MAKNECKNWKKILLLSGAGLVTLAAILALTLYQIVTYIPSDYQPAAIDLGEQERINHYADKKMEELYNRLQVPEPFAIRFEQKPLNELLLLAQEQHWFGKNVEFQRFQQPQIRFSQDRVSLMVRVERGSQVGLLTIVVKLERRDDEQVSIVLDQVKLGALPIPQSVLEPYFQKGLARLEAVQKSKAQTQCHSREQARSNWLGESLEMWQPKLEELLGRQQVLTQAGFQADEAWVRILALNIDNGTLEIKLAPQQKKIDWN